MAYQHASAPPADAPAPSRSAAAARPVARAPLRLLIVSSDCYPPRRVDVAVLFGEELAARGHAMDWILQSEAPCARAHVARWGGGTALVGPTDLGTSRLRRARKHLLGALHDLKVFAQLRRRRYDAVAVKDLFVSGAAALLAARLFRTPFVYWLSYPFPEDYLHRARSGLGRYPLLYRLRGAVCWLLLYKVLLRAADHVFVQSEQMRRDVAALGIAADKITAVPMGIKLPPGERPASADARSLIPAGVPAILYLGTLTRTRRLDFLVRVLAAVRRAVPDAVLYLVGQGDDPDDERLLRAEAERLALSAALVLVGHRPRDEALQYVREADVCVSPFYPTPILNSTSPTKLVEYMAMGKAVVANDHPEQRLVIEASGAGYCVPWNEEAFADAIVRLLRAPPDERARMGERGRRYVEEHRSYDRLAGLVERQLIKVTRDARAVR